MNKSGRKLILIGLDGATFDIILPNIRRGLLPTFSRIINDGASGTLMSTTPFNTLPAWTSIFTGVNPGKHGIADFMIRKGSSLVVPTTKDRMVDSLWRILDRYSVKQIIVNDPVTYPPEQINGIMISGFLVPNGSRDFAHPSWILDEIDQHCVKYIPELETGFEKLIEKDPEKGVQMINGFAESTFQASQYLAKNHEWDLLAAIFTSTDRLQHFYFHDQSVILRHYQLIDGMISSLMELHNDANVMIMSDHGFGPLNNCFYANSWLEAEGFARRKSDSVSNLAAKYKLSYPTLRRYSEKLKIYGFAKRIVPARIKRSLPESDHVSGVVDFGRSEGFCPGTGNGIFLSAEHPSIRDNLIGKLEKFSLDHEGFLQVSPQDKKIWGPFSSRAPDLLLTPSLGYEVSSHLVSESIAPPNQFGDTRTGTHRPEGIFMAFGPQIKRNSISRPIHVWDMTPTILHFLGLPTFTYMDGTPVTEIFKEEEKSLETPSVQISHRETLRQKIRELKSKK